MTVKTAPLHIVFISVLAAAIVLPIAAAEAACAPFPQIKIWGNYTHASVTRYVDTRLDGNWTDYVGRLENRLGKIRNLRDSGKPLALKYKGKRLLVKGRKLGAYLRAAERRLEVAQCLAEAADAESLQNFVTAAGGDTSPQAAPALKPAAIQTASAKLPKVRMTTVNAGSLKLRVQSQCAAGGVTFKITNLGKNWPKSGRIAIFGVGDGQPIKLTDRRMRFASEQLSTFRVKAAKSATRKFGLWVEPSWERREFAYDAMMACG